MNDLALSGVRLADLEPGSVVHVFTRSRCYQIERRSDGSAVISGHPEYCPSPVNALIGSTGRNGMEFVPGFVRGGMCMEVHCLNGPVFRTSVIVDVTTE